MEFEDAEWTPEKPWTLRTGACWVERGGKPVYWRSYGIFFGDDMIAVAFDPMQQQAAFAVEAANERQERGDFWPPEKNENRKTA